MKIITWNINSVRLRLPLVLRLLAEQQPDVLCLQEIESPERLKEEYLDYLERAKKAVELGQNWDK